MPERQVCTEISISTKFCTQHRNDLDYTYQHGCNRTSLRTQNYQDSTISFHVLHYLFKFMQPFTCPRSFLRCFSEGSNMLVLKESH